MRSLHHGLTILLGSIAAMGCGSKGAISLTVDVEAPEVAVTHAALGSQITGSFRLVFRLGSEADTGTRATVEQFQLVDAEGAAIGAPLDLTGLSGPVAIAIGATQEVPLTFQQGALLTADEEARTCPGPVGLSGAVTDTLSGGKTLPLFARNLVPDGC